MMYNQLPVYIRTFRGELKDFKLLLDRCLCMYPDEPATESLTPTCRTLMGKPSNSLLDWMRMTNVCDNDFLPKGNSKLTKPEEAPPSL